METITGRRENHHSGSGNNVAGDENFGVFASKAQFVSVRNSGFALKVVILYAISDVFLWIAFRIAFNIAFRIAFNIAFRIASRPVSPVSPMLDIQTKL